MDSPRIVCPQCSNASAVALTGINRTAHVDYYRCSECGRIWKTPKGQPSGTRRVVAEGRPLPAASRTNRPLLDGDLLQVQSVFRLVEAGLTFVRKASGSDGRLTAEALPVAQRTHRTIARLIGIAHLSPDEYARVQANLDSLRQLIVISGGTIDD